MLRLATALCGSALRFAWQTSPHTIEAFGCRDACQAFCCRLLQAGMTRRRSIAAADAAKGALAEVAFRQWLDNSTLPHIYVEQSPLTVPEPLRGAIKRPDYLVGIPGVGVVAFDVKAKSIYGDALLFDLAEVQKLRTFARLFHLTVYFACLDPGGGPECYWVHLHQLDEVAAVRIHGLITLKMPLSQAMPVTLQESFYDAFIRAVAL